MNIQKSDFERFNDIFKLSALLQSVCLNGEKVYSGFTNVVGDVWYVFFAVRPALCSSKKSQAPVQNNLLVKVMESDSYKSWHRLTAGDDLLSVITAITFSEQLIQWLEQNSTIQQAQQIVNSTQSKIDAASNTLQQLRKKKISLNATIEEKRQYHQNKHEQFEMLTSAQQARKQAKFEIQLEIERLSKDKLESMINKSRTNAKEIKKSVMSLSSPDGKQLANVPISDQLLLSDQLQSNVKLKRIAELTGRFKSIAKKKQRQIEKITMNRKDMTLGQEITRLLPIEQANLLLPNFKKDFLRRFSEHQTLVFDIKGKDRRGKGPIIICMDESSSMTTLKEQSKAFCLALLSIAHKQKRDFAIIPFASDIGDTLIFSKGRATTDEILSFTEEFLGGGTNFEKPLLASLNILSRSEFNLADILFVTDGTSFLSSAFIDQFNSIKKQRKFLCTAIVLTNLFNAVDLALVNRFCDEVIEVNDLFDAEDVFSIT
ncbi:vWA domain-containing protein [Lysinibacillus sp. 54212]|uniref:vWA domain-containing protein n=1 Tax=Lysinibacillus sp. 54212 TaxID=3119829 RepID=UPI002FC92FC5